MLGTSKFLIGDADKRYDTEGNLIERQRDDYQDFNLCNHYYDPFNTSHSPLSNLYCEQITSIKKDLFVEYELEESTSTFSETDTNDTIHHFLLYNSINWLVIYYQIYCKAILIVLVIVFN